jgi:F420-dependent oxidoreductase-like protein
VTRVDVLFGLQLFPQYVSWDELRAAAVLADQTGWDLVMTWDHFVPLMGDPTGPNLEGWQVLAGFATVTTRAKVGMLVTGNTYRHPAVLANMASTLDHLSHGRAVLGIGAAWKESEHRMYGIPFDTPAVRAAKLSEAARVIRRLLDEGRVTFRGRHYQLTDATLGTRPIQARLPILIGGGGERTTLRVAARYADLTHWFARDDVPRKLRVLRAHCQEVGRPFDDIRPTCGGGILVSEDPGAVAKRALAVNARYHATEFEEPYVTGSPDEIAKELARQYRSGIRGFVFGMPAPFDHGTIERTMTEVKPRLQALVGT